MRSLCVILFLVGASVASAKKRYDGYQLLEVIPKNAEHARLLMELETEAMVDLHNEISHAGKPVSMAVAPKMLTKVKVALLKAGLRFTVTNKNIQDVLDEEEKRLAGRMDFDVDDFNTLEDIDNQLEVWASGCPDSLTCSVYSIGTTFEGRNINAIRIGNGNPVIFMDTLIHAREWLTGATTLKIIDHLLTNYDSDDDVTYLLANYDFIFVPVANPDGYDYSWTDDRYWRKNRFDNDGHRCVGVDLNRNFDVDEFGLQGISTNPCSDIYCGTEGGSELETIAMQDEGLRLQGADESGIIAWVTIHSYSWMWMYPWGYTEDFDDRSDCVYTDDYDDLYYVSEAVQEAIFESSGDMWDIGTTCEVIYPTTGGTDDWVKAKAGVKFVFSPELRGPGFVVPPELIQPSFEEVWAGTVAMMNAIEDF